MKFRMVHENYNVADLEKSIAFYEKALGLHEVRRKNGNGFILGVSGSGKSFFSKREIVSIFLGTNDEIIIADPQNEYTPLVQALGGVAINLSPTSPNHINAMDLALGYGDSANPLIAKSEFVLSFIEQIMGGTGKLEAVDKSIIDRCLTKIYADYLDSGYSIDPPTLVDLHKELKKQKEKQAKELALALEMVSEGNLNMFAHQTNVDIHNRLISFGIRDLGKQLRTPGMLVMTDAIRNRVARNRERGIRTHVIMDEIVITKMTAKPMPMAVSVFLDTPMKGQMPKN